LATALFVLAAVPATAQQEQLMSKDPSECEVFAALSGDDSCAAEPAARGLSIEGDTQGLAISPDSGQGSGTGTATNTTSTTTKTKKDTATTAATTKTQPTTSGPKAATFDSIQFEFNSAELTDAARRTLDTVASVLREPYFADSRFIIEGHTDAKGSDDYNFGLSERRAQAVVRYLIESGVAPEQLSARGMGESKPFDRSNPEAAVNRRVVVRNLGG
jgi:outer membrane protein OmpA-like peptidoglycan-associated protein